MKDWDIFEENNYHEPLWDVRLADVLILIGFTAFGLGLLLALI